MDILQRRPPLFDARSRFKAPGYHSSQVWREGPGPRGCRQEGAPVLQNLLSPRNNIPSDSSVYQCDSRFFENSNSSFYGSHAHSPQGWAGLWCQGSCCPHLFSGGRRHPSKDLSQSGFLWSVSSERAGPGFTFPLLHPAPRTLCRSLIYK